jgi:hypothetical protein
VQSSERCVSAHRRVTIRVFNKIFYDFTISIPISLQIMEDEYIVDDELVAILLHLHLEYYTIN